MAVDLRNPLAVTERKLWFGLAAAAAAWSILGMLDLVITWRACTHQEEFGVPSAHSGVAVVFAAVSICLLVIAIVAGLLSYRNWRALRTSDAFLDSLAVGRREYMAFTGVICSILMAIGILWLAIPPFMLELCWRAR